MLGGDLPGQVRQKPGDGQLGDALQGTWLREQVAGAGHDLQPRPAGQPPDAGTCPKQADVQATSTAPR